MPRPKKSKLKGITLHEGQKAVWDVCKVQPSKPEYDKLWRCTDTTGNQKNVGKVCWGALVGQDFSLNADNKYFPLPFEVGERVYLREPYFWWIDHYVYKDSPEADNVPQWVGDSRMPEAAARKFAVCTGVEVVRCHDVSNEQLIAMGYTSPFAKLDVDAFNAAITRNHGQHAWDDNVYIFISSFKIEMI
jgi:hypothetical protein